MNLTRLALSNPVAVIVAVIMILMFGAISLYRLPVQMIPDVDRPLIQINTSWRAAAPEEVEANIVEPQEDALRGLPGLDKMEVSASRGRATVSLKFDIDVNIERALIETMNRLNRVPRYPADADEPVIYAGRDQFGSSIAWFAVRPKPGNNRDIASYQDFVEDVIQARIERVPGISNSNAYGGRQREVRITFDPYLAAAHEIDIPTLARLTGNNTDSSAGFSEVGRRQYTVRYAGKYEIQEFGDMVLTWRDGNPVRLRDIATVEIKLADRGGILSQNGGPSIAFNAQPAENINVLKVMAGLKAAIAELNEGVVAREGLYIEQVYDETLYIKDSIGMLRNNLLLGIALAVGILWWFMRRFRATMMVALAIPVSLFASFSLLAASGRTINIISLAGLAFAMGMVLDAAIVVLENIVRLREEGRPSQEAASTGTSQVWGALLASTATTVAIFLPILFLKDVAGQLFGDLAFTMALAIIVSLFIAVTIIPTAATSAFRDVTMKDPHKHWWENGTNLVMALTDTARRRFAWIVGLVILAASLTWMLMPAADYLPAGKQNWIFAFILPPPGQGVDTAESEFVNIINERMMDYVDGTKSPKAQSYFLGVFGSFGFMGVRMEDRNDVDAMLGAMNAEVLQGFPDTLAFASRPSIFRRLDAGRTIDVNIQSSDLDSMLLAARTGMGAIMQAVPCKGEGNCASVRPVPGVELAQPELRMIPNERRIVESGWSRQTMSTVIRALGDGQFVGEYFDGRKQIDVILRGPAWSNPEELASIPLVTPEGGIQQLGELISMVRTAGPAQIRRVDRRRTITLLVTPPEGVAIEEVMRQIKEKAAPTILAQLPEDGEISYYGSADNLRVALENMRNSFLLAIAILYLLMSALFRSFKDSLLVLLALPLATVGGMISLRLVSLFSFQPMDLLTMIGFITVLGLVVNNAILLVHQTRSTERDGYSRRDSVRHAVRIRLRPILMSTMTSLFGMLPLVVVPGPGTELYRGMAAVIVGGMGVSTVFTLILLPSLLRIGESTREASSASPGGMAGQYAQKDLMP